MTRTVEYVEVRVRPRTGSTRTAFFSTTAGKSPLVSLEFTTKRNGGCGTLTMQLDRDNLRGTIAARHLIEVWAKPTGGTRTQYYLGTIITVPDLNSSDQLLTYEAEGLWLEAQNQTVIAYYDGADTDDVIKVIIAEIAASTAISAATTEVSIATPYTMGDYESEFETAAEAIAMIAGVQTGAQYGVDEEGIVYFKDLITTDQATFTLGIDLPTFVSHDDASGIVNRVYVQSKTAVGGGNLTRSDDDSTSITAHGLSSRVFQAPALATTADITRYMTYLLGEYKDPVTVADTRPGGFTDFIFPRGNCRILKPDGSEVSLPIQSVTYRYVKDQGFTGELYLGDRPESTYDESTNQLLRQIEVNKSSGISITKIAHTRGQEFAQESRIDSRKLAQPQLNIFTDDLADLKAFDLTKSKNVSHRNGYLLGPLDYASCEMYSNIIDTGEAVPTVRLHVDYDRYGRINFDRQEDVDFFFEYYTDASATDAFRVREDDNRLEQFAIAGQLLMSYRDESAAVPAGQTGFTLPNSYYIWCGLDYATTSHVSTDEGYIYFGWNGVGDHQRLAFRNTATTMDFVWRKVVGSAPTNLESWSLTKDTKYNIFIHIRPSSNTSQIVVYLSDGTTVVHTSGTYNVISAAGYRAGLGHLYSSVSALPNWYIRFWEMRDDTGNMGIGAANISRDGGTTWTSAALVHGANHTSINISAQPSGTQLQVRLYLEHPARIYGWGISF